MEKEIVETSKKRWPKRLFIIIFLLSLFIIYVHKIEPSIISTREYPIINQNIPPSFNGFKIAHFSDIHFGRTTNETEVKKVVEKINEMKADIIVFSGDLFDPYITLSEENKNFLAEELSKMTSTLGKYAILGDNDLEKKDTFQEIMNKANFIVLDKNIPIYYKGNIPIFLQGYSSNQNIDTSNLKQKQYQITLCHEPIIFDEVYQKSNLVLAGHSLGGLVRLPFTNGLFKPNNTSDYIYGKYEKETSTLYVSNGIGTENLSIRFLNIPEINLYRLYNN